MGSKGRFRKAYDSVIWEAVEFALKKIGVARKFIQWVIACVQTPSYSIVLNKAPYGYFRGKRGIR